MVAGLELLLSGGAALGFLAGFLVVAIFGRKLFRKRSATSDIGVYIVFGIWMFALVLPDGLLWDRVRRSHGSTAITDLATHYYDADLEVERPTVRYKRLQANLA